MVFCLLYIITPSRTVCVITPCCDMMMMKTSLSLLLFVLVNLTLGHGSDLPYHKIKLFSCECLITHQTLHVTMPLVFCTGFTTGILLFNFAGTNIAEQFDAANIMPMSSPPPPSGSTPQSPVTSIPSSRPEVFNPGLVSPVVSPVNVPCPSVVTPLQPVPMVQDRPFVPGPSTSLPGGVVPKTERFDT